MKKYMILYEGPATPQDQMSKEKGEQIMAAWGKWMDDTGDALVDVGSPMTMGKAIKDNGQEDNSPQLNGYSVLQAEDEAAVIKLIENHPFLSDNDGKFAIDIFELLPVPV